MLFKSRAALLLLVPALLAGCGQVEKTETKPVPYAAATLKETGPAPRPNVVAQPTPKTPPNVDGVAKGAKAVTVVALEAHRQEVAARKEKAKRDRIKTARLERKQARQAAALYAELNPTTDGVLGKLTLPKTVAIENNLKLAIANIPNRTGHEGWVRSLNALTGSSPDFISLNEVSARPTVEIQSLAPAYGVVRGEHDPSLGGPGQSLNNVVLYRAKEWTALATGMVKVVDDDRGFMGPNPFVWDRYATWALLQNKKGEVVSVISTHMPTNPEKYPEQHGNPALSRAGLYGKGMEKIKAMEQQLSAYGPVLVTGDMNSHPGQAEWAAVPKMATAGYTYAKDSGVMYAFFKSPITIVESHEIAVDSDHPALSVTLAANGFFVD